MTECTQRKEKEEKSTKEQRMIDKSKFKGKKTKESRRRNRRKEHVTEENKDKTRVKKTG